MTIGKGYTLDNMANDTYRMAEAIRSGESANGFDGPWTRHRIIAGLGPSLLLSPGVLALAEAGAYWLLDIALSHKPAEYIERFGGRAFLTVEVAEDSSCVVTIHDGDDNTRGKPITQRIVWTDFPIGKLTLNMLWVYPDGTYESREPAILFHGEE